jgi:2-amino-4-hydroxy-6-hydroxymethyldihydropteridine diphosphokinase
MVLSGTIRTGKKSVSVPSPSRHPTPWGRSEFEYNLANARIEMVIIGLGSNVTSRWGSPEATILHALHELADCGVKVLRVSRLYRTHPLGPIDQPNFINAVALISTSRPPVALLSLLKRIEAKAGRRTSKRWGPRALDLDIVDYKRRTLNWAKHDKQVFNRSKLDLILPHSDAARRPFVLRPILDIHPLWHHPISGFTANQLLKRLRFTGIGQIISPTKVEISTEEALQGLRAPENIAT